MRSPKAGCLSVKPSGRIVHRPQPWLSLRRQAQPQRHPGRPGRYFYTANIRDRSRARRGLRLRVFLNQPLSPGLPWERKRCSRGIGKLEGPLPPCDPRLAHTGRDLSNVRDTLCCMRKGRPTRHVPSHPMPISPGARRLVSRMDCVGCRAADDPSILVHGPGFTIFELARRGRHGRGQDRAWLARVMGWGMTVARRPRPLAGLPGMTRAAGAHGEMPPALVRPGV